LRFAATLRAAGAPLRLPRGADPSLPLALGGAGITLRQAAGLYAALATEGSGGPLQLLAGAAADRPDFLPAAAARSVADVLTRPLPGFGPIGIAWKTGTSWGGRDAWALGFDSRHVVAVWIGRPDGTPLPGATGTSLALPQLARIFDLLPKEPRTVMTVQERPDHTATQPADALRLLFPPPGAVLSADGQVTIRAMGGRRPLTFMIDGALLPADRVRRDAAWLPTGPGFYRLTVLDADGAAVRSAVQVRASP
jgi:penicillin-binding protein 1C